MPKLVYYSDVTDSLVNITYTIEDNKYEVMMVATPSKQIVVSWFGENLKDVTVFADNVLSDPISNEYKLFEDSKPIGPITPAQRHEDPIKATIRSLDAAILVIKNNMYFAYTHIAKDEPLSFSSRRSIVRLFYFQRQLYDAQKTRRYITDKYSIKPPFI